MGSITETKIDHSVHPRVNSTDPLSPRPRPVKPAHVIRSEEEAIQIAEKLAASFKVGAALRDREGLLPIAELDAYSQSGLWSINVPKAYGGPEVSYATLAKVIAIIAAADPAIAQITQNHLAIVATVDLDGTEGQKKLFFGWALEGIRYGNAFSELKSKTVADFETKVVHDGDDVVVNGEKFYTTGALLAHIVPIVGVDETGQGYLVFADRDAPGLTVTNNWSSFGQRTTASGSVKIENVRVPKARALKVTSFDHPTVGGPVSQIIQSAIDVGIARGTIDDTIEFVSKYSRPWIDSGKATAGEDLFTIAQIGDLKIKLHAAEALLEIAGHAIDVARANPTLETVSEATIKTGESKVLTTEIAILSTNKLFELAGTRSTLAEHGLDRHWRNARVHTLHDPVRWKFYHVGNYYLNRVHPPRHAWN
ncbi:MULTISPECIES: SfnB family sulfur acquisition oxidoreductase [Rhizobium]|uniref:SfnB family sulfur acquisition oxidoreductase n=3 Tax=Rhizobium TaxID=379 RepID=A0A6P1CDP1_RHITR|nr:MULTISPECIES: SfnB family sulfur acquisition oxidoreductase [Rhizobium]AGB73363.1 putative Acyl-CoA dehydrogenase [Rhizobium tropici CIAT 899]AYG76693.1 SfnB family sulfur acquisition oxidoreductase [Rhizobium sp. CCGE532]ENN86668.1 putative Acyl-CoA dehydrogenase [Rhizobium freirei PRF 81]MBB4245295.1 SfnB family sulfur acquisition oxidoreductase [Rhizobium tropici]MBB5596621.1 SfnB family sulfur acquisition oxidoreductase [Rhizobium tropici]